MKNISNIILADDHHLFTEGLSALFENDQEINVIRIYHEGKTLLKEIELTNAHVMLLDVKMGQPDGMEILQEVRKRNIPIRIIMLSTYSDPMIILECKKRGADGYLLKNTSRDELKSSIKKVMKGEKLFNHLLLNQQTEEDKFEYFHNCYKVTRREWEILLLIKNKFTNQMISEKFHLSIYTVETHRKNLMNKLKLKSPVALHQFISFHDI
jgi:DNA-binding NarL/FixJ family response regulator